MGAIYDKFLSWKDRVIMGWLSKDKQELIKNGIAPGLHWMNYEFQIEYAGKCMFKYVEFCEKKLKTATGLERVEWEQRAKIYNAWGNILLTPPGHPRAGECEQLREYVSILMPGLSEQQREAVKENMANEKSIAKLKGEILVSMARDYEKFAVTPE